ncbi:MAG: ABC transporter ATP-binding protein [Spirochaetaceae bacterium]|nr:MAG: ABC transporter ATP-binding protein [Spirochaetaceae bacterium]
MSDATGDALLDVRNLRMHFTSGRGTRRVHVKAVDDVSFSISRGETFGLVGESGCGKTTTGRTIIRLYNPTGGQVFFEGHDISGRLSPRATRLLATKMQMIFQDPMASLNPRMTVEEIVGEGLTVAGEHRRSERLKKIHEMLEIVGLSKDHANRYPHEFSGGQRQRIGIARAIITEPSLVIADEPVSALDVSIQAQVINLFNALKERMGLTVLFIAHNLSVVKYFSDRIGVMYGGKLVEIARSDDLYRSPTHPYTRSLLSAIPQPDPYSEKRRRRIPYDPSQHDYEREQPSYHEVSAGHWVYCSDTELQRFANAGT